MLREVSCATDAFLTWRHAIDKQQKLRQDREAGGELEIAHPTGLTKRVTRPQCQVSACVRMRYLRKKWAFDRLRTWQDHGRLGSVYMSKTLYSGFVNLKVVLIQVARNARHDSRRFDNLREAFLWPFTIHNFTKTGMLPAIGLLGGVGEQIVSP